MNIVRDDRRAPCGCCAPVRRGAGRAGAHHGRPARRSRVAVSRGARRVRPRWWRACSSTPAQFGDPADLARYPRDEARDVATAERAGVDVLFAPAVEEMYPPGFDTWVDVEGLGSILEGAFRPGHFRGVATICLKLFNIVRPERGVLRPEGRAAGAVIRQMIRDLHLDLELRVCPTVRDADGLALSSRNVRLRPCRAASCARAAARAREWRSRARRARCSAAWTWSIVEVAPFDPPVLAAAVRVGGVRLIDNVPLERGPRHDAREGPAPLAARAGGHEGRGERIVMVTTYDAPARGWPKRRGSMCCSSATPLRWSCSDTSPRCR